jgi:hypothetical protein
MFLNIVLMLDQTSHIQIEHVWRWSYISDMCFESRSWNLTGYLICPIYQTCLTQVRYDYTSEVWFFDTKHFPLIHHSSKYNHSALYVQGSLGLHSSSNSGETLQENDIHSLVILNSSVPTNVFKLYSSVLIPMNITLYSLVGYGNWWIYGSSGLTLTCHYRPANIHRLTDEYMWALETGRLLFSLLHVPLFSFHATLCFQNASARTVTMSPLPSVAVVASPLPIATTAA